MCLAHVGAGREKKESNKWRYSEQYNQWAHNSSRELPFKKSLPCAGHCFPTSHDVMGTSQITWVSSAVPFTKHVTHSHFLTLCASTFLTHKMGVMWPPPSWQRPERRDYPHEACSVGAGPQ